MALVVFGVFTALLVLELALRAGGLTFLWLQARRNTVSLRQGASYRVLCIGESTTALGGGDSYPAHLERELNRRGRGITFSVINGGIPAVSTEFIVSRLEATLAHYRPHIMVAMMGINDPLDDEPSVGLRLLRSLRAYKLVRWLAEAAAAAGHRPANRPVAQPGGSTGSDATTLQGAAAADPRNVQADVDLARVYAAQGKLGEAEASLRGALRLAPSSVAATSELALVYFFSRRFSEARALLQGLAETGRADEAAREMLRAMQFAVADDDLEHGRLDDAEAELRALEVRTVGDRTAVLAKLASLYHMRGDQAAFDEYRTKADEMRGTIRSEMTQRSYLVLDRMLESRGIPLVAVQYPLRPVEPLRRLVSRCANVVVVDNERVFQQALRRARYDRYFSDTFAGDFGHTTPRGARVLAKNVAAAILRDVIGMRPARASHPAARSEH